MRHSDDGHGRDILVDGPFPPLEIGVLIARALGLTPASVLTEEATQAQRAAVWDTGGRLEVWSLGAGGDLRTKVDILLFDRPIPLDRLPRLARRHGLTIAWDANPGDEGDWHHHVALPDGTVGLRRLSFDYSGDGGDGPDHDAPAVRIVAPTRAG